MVEVVGAKLDFLLFWKVIQLHPPWQKITCLLPYRFVTKTRQSGRSTSEVAIAGLRHNCIVGVLKAHGDASI
jgi:hypothetical protein